MDNGTSVLYGILIETKFIFSNYNFSIFYLCKNSNSTSSIERVTNYHSAVYEYYSRISQFCFFIFSKMVKRSSIKCNLQARCCLLVIIVSIPANKKVNIPAYCISVVKLIVKFHG